MVNVVLALSISPSFVSRTRTAPGETSMCCCFTNSLRRSLITASLCSSVTLSNNHSLLIDSFHLTHTLLLMVAVVVAAFSLLEKIINSQTQLPIQTQKYACCCVVIIGLGPYLLTRIATRICDRRCGTITDISLLSSGRALGEDTVCGSAVVLIDLACCAGAASAPVLPLLYLDRLASDSVDEADDRRLSKLLSKTFSMLS